MLQDIRYAIRSLRHSPAFTLVVLLTLALGIGANTAVFSVVNGVLLRPLPYGDPERLVAVYETRNGNRGVLSPPDYVDFRRQTGALEDLAAYSETSFAVSGWDSPAEQIDGARVSANIQSVLGVPPLLGRSFVPAEDIPGQNHVAVMSYGLWQRRFGGDGSAVGNSVQLDGERYEIVGILPPGAEFPRGADLWVPIAFTERDLMTQRGAHYLGAVGRLRVGSTVELASAQLNTVAGRLAAEYSSTNRESGATAVPLRESIVGDVHRPLILLLGAVGLVLLIACTNVANLLLNRAQRRERELSVRLALGAGRARLVRGVLAESLVLAVGGGAAGIAVALGGVEALKALQAGTIPRLGEVQIDTAVLVFTLGIALVAGVLFGLLPAFNLTRREDLRESLTTEGRSLTAHRQAHRSRGVLVVAEMALALVLLAGAGLLVRSFVSLTRVSLGFTPDHVLTFGLSLPDARYDTPEKAEAFYAELIERLETVPGVEAAGATFGLPLTDFRFGISAHDLDGRALSDEEQDRFSTQVRIVTPDYFRVMGMEVVRGRNIADADRHGSPPVMVVNEAAAALLWPGVDPIGHRLTIGTSFGLGRGRAGGEVVGVLRNTRDFGLGRDVRPEIYLAHRQFPNGYMSVAVRTTGDPAALARTVPAQVATLDPELPAFEVRPMDEWVARSVSQPRFYMVMLTTFSGVALALAAIGIYGVMACVVGERTREIGLRIALGAEPGEVLGFVVGRGMLLAGAGALAGLVAAVAGTRLLRRLLFDVVPTDPSALGGAAVLLGVVALVACYLPARRAARVDPIEALRYE